MSEALLCMRSQVTLKLFHCLAPACPAVGGLVLRTQVRIIITSVTSSPQTTKPGGVLLVTVLLQNATGHAGSLSVTSQPGVTCDPATFPNGTISVNTNCTVDPTAAPGAYILTVLVKTDAGQTTTGAGSVDVLPVRSGGILQRGTCMINHLRCTQRSSIWAPTYANPRPTQHSLMHPAACCPCDAFST